MTNTRTPKSTLKVESFDLDHSKVRAPYVRLAGQYVGPNGDEVKKYDLRLAQPNGEVLSSAAMHTLEHLLAGYLRESFPSKVIDASPMGCRTGFYLTTLGPSTEADAKQAFEHALTAISSFTGEVPGSGALECGNYRDHSLEEAQTWARRVLEQQVIIQETVRLEDAQENAQPE